MKSSFHTQSCTKLQIIISQKRADGFHSAWGWRVKGQPLPPLYSLSPWFLLASLLVIFTLVWPLPPRFSLLWALLPSCLCGWTKIPRSVLWVLPSLPAPQERSRHRSSTAIVLMTLARLSPGPHPSWLVGHVGWTFSAKNQDGFNLERTDWALCAEVSEAGYLKLHGGCVCSEMAPGIFSEVVRRTAPLPDPTACPSPHHTPLHVPDWGCSPLRRVLNHQLLHGQVGLHNLEGQAPSSSTRLPLAEKQQVQWLRKNSEVRQTWPQIFLNYLCDLWAQVSHLQNWDDNTSSCSLFRWED